MPKPSATQIEDGCRDRETLQCWHADQNTSSNELIVWWTKFQRDSPKVAADIKDVLLELLPIFGKDFCRVAEMVRATLCLEPDSNSEITCDKIGLISTEMYPQHLTKGPQPLVKHKAKARVAIPTNESRSMNEGQRADFTPCSHEGPCTKENCDCVKAGVHCEKYCGCNHNRPNQPRNASLCYWAFKGCACRSEVACMSKACLCFSWKRECDPDLCKNCHECKVSSSGERTLSCRNIGLQKGKGHRTAAGWSDVHGWGVFSTGSIAKNEVVGEYVGEIIEDQDAERRGRVYDLHNSNYLFQMTYNYSLDSSRLGNKLRYVNHSGNPNCEARLMRVNGDVRVGIFARSDIKPFEELFFDYGPKFVKQLKINNKKKSSTTETFRSNSINGSMPLLPPLPPRRSVPPAPLRRTSSAEERRPVPALPPPPAPVRRPVAPPAQRTNSDDGHATPASVLGTKRRAPSYAPGSDGPDRRAVKRAKQSPPSSADTIAAVVCLDDDDDNNAQPHPNLVTPKPHARDPKPVSQDGDAAQSAHSLPQQSPLFHQTNGHASSRPILCATNLDIPASSARERPPPTVTDSENNAMFSNNVNSTT